MTTIDWVILAVILFCTIMGLYRGFVATVVYAIGSLASLAASVFIALRLQIPLSRFLMPVARRMVLEVFPQAGDANASIAETWEHLSDYLQGILSKRGITLAVLQEQAEPAKELLNALARPLAECAAFVLILMILYAVLRVVLSWLLAILGIITHLPILHSCNALLGGALGAATGVVLCTIVLWSMKLFAPAVYSDVGMLSPSVMQQSAIARTLVGWNDGVSLFEPEIST